MNTTELEGKFNQVKGKLKQKYAEKISEDDLQYSEGKFDEMLGKLQEKTGKTKEELEKEIKDLK
ncbi:CsbD family protein [Psychroflexus aestuariivivens]|uniref:CsbD family protein n=1 Tax=Psychroflexus aestuariivivens TaxID=1795040 RepID=UPI000FDC5D8E|nr:CsbD family protein [Psychroflexus aestuariivivens]